MDEWATAPAVVARGAAMTTSEQARFVEAIRSELPRLQRIARLLTGDPHVADDIAAEAIARSLSRWRSGEIEDASIYLRRVVINLVSRRWRRAALAIRRDHLALDWLPHPQDIAAASAERDRALLAVMRLPVRRRAIVVLRFYDDMPLAEIADLLGINVGTVKSQLSRALEQLRADLGALEES
jgi:RNA polymerase sigma factor (sigma-70 family)